MSRPSDPPPDGPEAFHDDGPHPITALRERVLRSLLQGVPADQVEDELIREGMTVEDAVTLVSSVARTGYHDGVVTGYDVYAGDQKVGFEEDHLSKRKRARAERGQREIRRIARGDPEVNPDVAFADAPPVHAQRAALRRSEWGFGWLLVVGALVAAAGGLALFALG